jgi:hypothetical protein
MRALDEAHRPALRMDRSQTEPDARQFKPDWPARFVVLPGSMRLAAGRLGDQQVVDELCCPGAHRRPHRGLPYWRCEQHGSERLSSIHMPEPMTSRRPLGLTTPVAPGASADLAISA